MNVFSAIILLILWLSAGERSLAAESRYFIDSTGKTLKSLNIDFGIATTSAHEIRSTDYIIKLVGENSSDIGRRIAVRSGICRIGNETIPAANVRTTMNGKESVTMSEARDGIRLVLLLKNPQRFEGPIQCEGFDLLIQ